VVTTVEDPILVFLKKLSVQELFICSMKVIWELRDRGVVRSGNAPAGDYAEWLVERATGGRMADRSQKSYDVISPNWERLQVKARVVTDMRRKAGRALSVIRTWDFDRLVVVLFRPGFMIERAVVIPAFDSPRYRVPVSPLERPRRVRGRRVTRPRRGLDRETKGGRPVTAVTNTRKFGDEPRLFPNQTQRPSTASPSALG